MIQHTKRINLINPQLNSIVQFYRPMMSRIEKKVSEYSSHEISDKIYMAMNELVSTSVGGKAY